MTDSEPETIMQEYAHSCRIVEEERKGDSNQYHYEGPMSRIKTFENSGKARLYPDVQTATGGFRGEKTGERGARLRLPNPVKTC